MAGSTLYKTDTKLYQALIASGGPTQPIYTLLYSNGQVYLGGSFVQLSSEAVGTTSAHRHVIGRLIEWRC